MWFVILGALLCALSWSGSVIAADTAATFSQAVDLFTASKYDEALPLFREAHEGSGSPNARIYVARCLRELGRVPEAYEEMKGTVADAAARAETEKKYIPTRDSAAAELALLERRVGQLVIAVTAPPADTVVQINGSELDSSKLGLPVAVHPGKVAVSVRAPGKEPVHRAIEVPAGQTRSLALTLEDAAADGPAVPEADPSGGADEIETDGGELRIVGFVVAGLGLAGIGVFAATASMAKSDYDELDDECGGSTCPPSEQGRVDDGRTLTTVANVSLIAGSVLVAGGVAMILFGGPSESDDSASAALTMAPIIGPEAGGLTLVGRF
ncbi:MAG: hypothetical protein JRI68_13505 [Deltaproteobacteria bacterium]|nr:hypothetical protein [Deltaproteobacteria bacterium]